MPATCPLKRYGDKEYYCPVELALQIIGGKWKPLVLWHLASQGVLRFSELKRTIPSITQKMLTQQLRELESDGLVERTVYPQVPPKVEYSLTPLGQSVEPVLVLLNKWGRSYEQSRAGAKTKKTWPDPVTHQPVPEHL